MLHRVALITNATHFVGQPAVRALLDDDFRVVAQDPEFASTASYQSFIDSYPGVECITTEIPEKIIREVFKRYGKLDVLLSNDVFPAIHESIEEADSASLVATFNHLNVFPFRLLQAVIPKFKQQGSGNIVMVTSCRTELPMAGGAIPDMARAAANALVKSASIELAPYNIPVNAIAPNFLYSEAYFPKARYVDDPKGAAFIRSAVPAGRLGDPEEVGQVVSFLANLKGSFQTGAIIKFSGGWPAAPARPAE